MKPLGIALLGLGTVGSAVYNTITTQNTELARRAGRSLEIRRILVKDITKSRTVNVPSHLLTTDISQVIDDPEVDVAVEVIGGIIPAVEYLRDSILAGKHIVTANKELLAKHGKELLGLADKQGVHFHFEATAGGGIPIIKALKESLAANEISKVMGIINGTTNYILTEMAVRGISLEEALSEAQAKGYAEADPSSDVDGYDVGYKLLILGSIAFGARLDLDKINIEGIRRISSIDLEYGRKLGYTLKLLAIAKDTPKGIEARVHPTFIPNRHPLASVSGVFNAVYVEGDPVGELMFYGRGAGGSPTASAVCSDIIDVARDSGTKRACSCLNVKNQLPMETTISKYYVRFSVLDQPGVLGQIAAAFGRNNVSLHSVIQQGRGEPVPLVFVTHEVKEAGFCQAIEEIKSLDCVFQVDNVIRVEEEV